MLRLLNLAPTARTLLERGEIEMGHARALLSLDASQQDALAREVADKSLTVRETERRVSAITAPNKTKPKADKPKAKDADTLRLEQQLTEKIGAPVVIDHGAGGKGKLVISYSSLSELDGVLGHLK
jgi:ParB family chromosome partitioning protein